MSKIRSKVYVAGDNIDTDNIIPAQYLNLVPTIPEEYEKLGSYAMAGLPDDAAPFVDKATGKTPYGILVAGTRIFFRNSVATGEVYPFETATPLVSEFKTGDEAELDTDAHTLTRLSDGKVFPLKDLGAVAPVVEAGGMFAYARKVGMIPSAAH